MSLTMYLCGYDRLIELIKPGNRWEVEVEEYSVNKKYENDLFGNVKDHSDL